MIIYGIQETDRDGKIKNEGQSLRIEAQGSVPEKVLEALIFYCEYWVSDSIIYSIRVSDNRSKEVLAEFKKRKAILIKEPLVTVYTRIHRQDP